MADTAASAVIAGRQVASRDGLARRSAAASVIHDAANAIAATIPQG
jgi:hypothetical protein